jgi:uncharacterized protein (TIGR00730 family)
MPRPSKSPDQHDTLLKDIEGLLEDKGPEAELIREMIGTAIKCARDGTDRGDLKVLNQVLKELRYAFRVFAPYRKVRKVSVFGSARTEESAPEFVQARTFANRMTRSGWMVITGAGGGIMEAAQGGAGRARSFGVNIRLPFEQKANTIIADDHKLINFKYFFTRKLNFVKQTDAIALFPGGFGTHDEGFESLTLVQTGKTDLLPIVFIDRPGGTYWSEWKKYVQNHLRDCGYVDPGDLDLFTVTDDLDVAVETIEDFYKNYHSSRYVSGRLVLRHQSFVNDELLEKLNDEFSEIVTKGRIERCEVHSHEGNEPETHQLHRLGLWFDRRNLSRLRNLIDMLNSAG